MTRYTVPVNVEGIGPTPVAALTDLHKQLSQKFPHKTGHAAHYRPDIDWDGVEYRATVTIDETCTLADEEGQA